MRLFPENKHSMKQHMFVWYVPNKAWQGRNFCRVGGSDLIGAAKRQHHLYQYGELKVKLNNADAQSVMETLKDILPEGSFNMDLSKFVPQSYIVGITDYSLVSLFRMYSQAISIKQPLNLYLKCCSPSHL